MSIHLESKDLINVQQMEVAVNGPDGATHLILCQGVADLGAVSDETYTFFVGPQLSRRQFVAAIASGAFSKIEARNKEMIGGMGQSELGVNLISVGADYDDENHQVRVRAQVAPGAAMINMAISYSVSILAELPCH
jgi:hypothetical protein